jgi:hypothetical protein
MKSIKEWMIEHGMGHDDIENMDLVRILGSSSVKVNRALEVKLEPKLKQVLSSEEFADEDPSELLRQIIVIAAKKISGVTGSTFSVPKATPGLSAGESIAKEAP